MPTLTEQTKQKRAEYHNRPEWSYSQMKVILDSGIDYAVAKKNGLLPAPDSKAIDIGSLVHQFILGGDEQYVVSPYDNYRTKESQDWKKEQIAKGKIILTEAEEAMIGEIAENIKNHPYSKEYIFGKGIQHEVEMDAVLAGIPVRGKADALKIGKGRDHITVLDLKTTAQFDAFKYRVFRNHYDLQCATYSVIAAATQGRNLQSDMDFVDYVFCVAETVPPYRVQYMKVNQEFVNHGIDKLNTCLTAIKEFGDKKPNFLLEEIVELGDLSY